MKEHVAAIRRLLFGSAAIVSARLGGACIVVTVQAAIARHCGADALGGYLLAIAAANLVGCAMPLGFQAAAAFFAAEYRARGERERLHAFLQRARLNILIVLAAATVAALLAAALPDAWHLVPKEGVAIVLFGAAIGIVSVDAAVLIGLGRPLVGSLVDSVGRPLVVAASLLAFLAAGGSGDLSGLIALIGLGYAAVALWQMRLTGRVLDVVPPAGRTGGDEKRWWRYALPWAVSDLVTEFFFDIDLLLLARFLDRDELATFGICARLFAFAAFGIATIYAIAMPGIVAAATAGDRDAMRRRAGRANLAACGAAAAGTVVLWFVGPFVLGLFGRSFTAGAATLALLCAGLVGRCAFGPAGLLLSTRDRPTACLPAVAAGLSVLAGANTVLVPALGIEGAALAAVLAIVVWSVVLWATAFCLFGVDVSLAALLPSEGDGVPRRDRRSRTRTPAGANRPVAT